MDSKEVQLKTRALFFFRTLARQFRCCAHIGSIGLADLVDKPEEIFGRTNHALEYQTTRIGLTQGLFYAENSFERNCFFPIAVQPLWDVRSPSGDGMQYLVECGAVALYVNAVRDDAVAETQSLLLHPAAHVLDPLYPFQENWLHSLADLYSLIVIAGDDGLCLQVYTRNAAQLSIISSAVEKSVASITRSSWYAQNYLKLQWSDLEGCLKI